MRATAIYCLFVLLVLGTGLSSAQETANHNPPLVGNLRELSKFDFQGNDSFSALKLWMGLNTTFDFPELSHPLAPRDKFLAAIESRLQLGYEHAGFPDASIKASPNANMDRVVVQISEGPRYFCGPVEIIGAHKIPTEPIITALTVTNTEADALPVSFQFQDNAPANRTQTSANENPGIWAKGQPAHFDQVTLDFLADRITNTLAKCGFFSSRFGLNIVTNAASRTATLQLKFTEEGPSATIDQIELVGNRKNSRAEILNYLDVKPGTMFTCDLAATMDDLLYHSARFLTNSVRFSTPDASGRVKLTIEVFESKDSPLLNQNFSPVEQALLKARNWLANLGNTDDEMVMTAAGYPDKASEFQCVLAPKQGLLVVENEKVANTNRFCRALVATSSQLAFYQAEPPEKYATRFTASQFKSYINLETGVPKDEGGGGSNIAMGAGLASVDDATNRPPCALTMSLAPEAFVRLAHLTNFANWFANDQLICSNANFALKLDPQTGRLIEFTAQDTSANRARMSLSFKTNMFESVLGQIENVGATFTNVCRTNAQFSSAVGFFGSELAQIPAVGSYLQTILPAETCAQLPVILRHLGNNDFLSKFTTLFDNLYNRTNTADERFSIPHELQRGEIKTPHVELASYAALVLAGSDWIFKPQSWPWTLTRVVSFGLRGQNTYVPADLTSIYSSDGTGPIGYLETATFLKASSPTTAKGMAKRGLQDMSVEAFRRDYQVLLDEHYVAGQFITQSANILSDLNEVELNALLAPLNKVQAKFFRDCIQRMHAAPKSQPLVETIAPALDAFWEKSLKQTVASQLEEIINK